MHAGIINFVVVYNNKLIKSADPVTYDKNGNVISLDERFNVDNDDLRYSLSESETEKTLKDIDLQYDAQASMGMSAEERTIDRDDAIVKYSLDEYTEKQYNDFGWARVAEAITINELDDMYSKIQEKGSLKKFAQSSNGEAIIEVNDRPHTTLGVNNKFLFGFNAVVQDLIVLV